MDADAHGARVLPPEGPSQTYTQDEENSGPDLVVLGVQHEAAGELGRTISTDGPIRHPWQVGIETQLTQMTLRVEDVGAQELPAVREPLGHEVDDGVRVDALLRAHVAGLEQGAPPEVLDPLPDRVMHIVLRLYQNAVSAWV